MQASSSAQPQPTSAIQGCIAHLHAGADGKLSVDGNLQGLARAGRAGIRPSGRDGLNLHLFSCCDMPTQRAGLSAPVRPHGRTARPPSCAGSGSQSGAGLREQGRGGGSGGTTGYGELQPVDACMGYNLQTAPSHRLLCNCPRLLSSASLPFTPRQPPAHPQSCSCTSCTARSAA